MLLMQVNTKRNFRSAFRDAAVFTSGIIEDEEGIVVMYYKQLLRGDKFKFVSRIDNEQS